MIRPTIGRIVYFHADNEAHEEAAVVVDVLGDNRVNLTVFSHDGEARAECAVRLVQPEEDDIPPHVAPYCRWMPYQVKKAIGSESGESAAGQETI
jgi:hypothetical protein